MEDAAKADPILEELVYLKNGVVGLVRATVSHIVDMQHHLHPPLLVAALLSLSPQRGKRRERESGIGVEDQNIVISDTALEATTNGFLS